MADQGSVGQLGPWIISGIALIQVWVIAMAKKLRKASVDIYESGTIEVGYSGFGPTLGLTGTLRAVRKDVFIKRVTVKVIKLKDGATHNFNWRAFRSNTFSLNPSDPVQLEIASSFLLTEENPFKYNIFFVDDSFAAEVAPKVGGLSARWYEFRTNRLKQLEAEFKDTFSLLLENPMLNATLYDEFSASGGVLDSYTVLDRACYWEAGDYQIFINIEATKPDKVFTKGMRYVLTDDDVNLLRLNTITILRSLCGFSDRFNFAYPEYKA